MVLGVELKALRDGKGLETSGVHVSLPPRSNRSRDTPGSRSRECLDPRPCRRLVVGCHLPTAAHTFRTRTCQSADRISNPLKFLLRVAPSALVSSGQPKAADVSRRFDLALVGGPACGGANAQDGFRWRFTM